MTGSENTYSEYGPVFYGKNKQELFSAYGPVIFYSPILRVHHALTAILLPQPLLLERAPLSFGLRTRYSYLLSLIVLIVGRRKVGAGKQKEHAE